MIPDSPEKIRSSCAVAKIPRFICRVRQGSGAEIDTEES